MIWIKRKQKLKQRIHFPGDRVGRIHAPFRQFVNRIAVRRRGWQITPRRPYGNVALQQACEEISCL
jgi:hypothetical protein